MGTIPANTAKDVVATYTPPSPAPASPNNVFTITALQAPNTTGPCIVVAVLPTNNSLLTANLVFRFTGFSKTAATTGLTFAIIGRFTADGNGHITNGLEDVNIAQADGSSVASPTVAFTGTYNMVNSSYGTMQLTVTPPLPAQWGTALNPPPTTMNFSFVLSLDGTFGSLIETDGAAVPVEYTGSGDFQIQGANTNFNVSRFFPSYILSLDGPAGFGAAAAHKGLIGRLDLSAGTIAKTSSSDDQSGTAANVPLSGTYSVDDAVNGHGEFKIMGGANPNVTFYIIRRGVFYALRIDQNAASLNPDGILLGTLHSIPVDAGGTPINFDSTAFINANFIFNLLGITDSHSASGPGHGSAVTGNFSGADTGALVGNLTGSMDINDGGAVFNLSFTGATPPNTALFNIAANGRGTAAFTLSGVTYNFVFYARSTTQGFLLEQPASDMSNRGRSGGWLAQAIAPPIKAQGANGTYIAATAVATAASVNSLAVLSLNGYNNGADNSGVSNGTSYSAGFGLGTPAGKPVGGNFTVTNTTSGRGTISMFTGTLAGNNNTAFEVYDAADAILIGIDNGFNLEPQIISLDQ